VKPTDNLCVENIPGKPIKYQNPFLTMSPNNAATNVKQPAQKKPRTSPNAMFAASARSRKKTLKTIFLEIIKDEKDLKKNLSMRTRKFIIEQAMVKYGGAESISGDTRKEVIEFMVEKSKNLSVNVATAKYKSI